MIILKQRSVAEEMTYLPFHHILHIPLIFKHDKTLPLFVESSQFICLCLLKIENVPSTGAVVAKMLNN